MPAKTLSISCWNVASVSVLGDWVLVWSISNENKTSLLTNLTSSFVELQLTSDNSTLLDTSCSKYSMNLTMLSDASQKFELATSGLFEENGVQTPYELTATVEFYETHKDCMTLFYKVTGGQYLLHYRREGRRQDAEQLVVVHDDHKKVAECLKFPFENPFIYDEAAGRCRRLSNN
uniref:Lipocalin/cytosolic fatty-acid binding domain-containing protein n=1 Tax=Sparus aurata TaxID=8175 RepID=A0A671UR01_SPAAU